ncbi:MAG: hypothetical protein ACLVAW_30055 [Eisenbergiella massiliensis]
MRIRWRLCPTCFTDCRFGYCAPNMSAISTINDGGVEVIIPESLAGVE